MTHRSHALMLLVCAAIGAACGSERGLEPEPPFEPEPSPVFTTLEVTPTAADLFDVAPGNTVQLTIGAWDQTGARMPGTGAATYSSSAPAIAGVSSRGVVTAAAPGGAEITAALTLGGITRTASMTVTVQARDYSDIAGVYDLTAVISSFDPVWGDLEGYRYTAVLTLQEESGPPWFGGTYADLRLIGPAGESHDVADAGVLASSIDPGGRVVLVLDDGGFGIGLTLIVGTVASGSVNGTFGCCGHISGTFTAERRPQD
jgi:hypothetical protein